MEEKRKFPVSDDCDIEYICPSASWGDMTGLIPANPTDEEKIKSYYNIYPYMPKEFF